MKIDYQITSAFALWRAKKVLYSLIPSCQLRKKLRAKLPRKWDVISYSPRALEQYGQILQRYPDVASPEETCKTALEIQSFSRIGDGEFNVIIGGRNSFNQSNAALAERLKDICEQGTDRHCLVCLNNYKIKPEHPAYTWFLYHGARYLDDVLHRVSFASADYGDAYFLLRISQDQNGLKPEGLARLKALWNGKKVLFVCNRKSPLVSDKLGFFAEIATKEFLFVPDKDAFDSYDDILTDIKKYDTSWQIYLEVGATASVLAWDLSHQGYHALDMGDFYKRSLCTCGEDAD